MCQGSRQYSFGGNMAGRRGRHSAVLLILAPPRTPCCAGGKRGIGLNEERDQTLNQLLTGEVAINIRACLVAADANSDVRAAT